MKCRVCKSKNYKSVLDMGSIYPSNFIDNGPEVEPKPLHLVQCNRCDLVQLKETFDLNVMYKEHYWYRSGLNPNMVESLQDIVNGIEERISLEPNIDSIGREINPMVLDIGCNDGTMLGLYSNKNMFKVGVDPAPNLKCQAKNNCDYFINDFFSYDTIDKHVFGYHDRAYKVISAIAMFYDLEDPNSFLKDVTRLLADDGIFVLQFTDLLSMLKINAFDNICHEHLEYYSLGVLYDLLIKNNLRIFDLEYNDVNGGSIRVYARHVDYPHLKRTYPKVMDAISHEKEYLKNHPIDKFNITVLREKGKLLSLIASIKLEGKSIYVLGASTKGNTLLQHYGLDSTLIDNALEINKDKFGKRTIGTRIPIIAEEEGLKEKPDYLLVLPWHFRKFFENKFRGTGIKLIFPLPEVTVVETY